MNYEDLFHTMKERRSIRKFTDEKIQRSTINELLRGAITAPSGSNIQSWVFGIIDKKELIEKILLVSPGISSDPETIVAFCTNSKLSYEKGGNLGREMAIIDISMAAQNFILLATTLGLGTCIVKSFNKIAVKNFLRLPESISPELLITIGKYKNKPKSPPKKNIEDLVFINNWESEKNE